MRSMNDKKTLHALADEQVLELLSSWRNDGLVETDWTRVKSLDIRNLLDERRKQVDIAAASICTTCPQFLKHFAMQHDEWLIKENISQLRALMSDQNLRLLPDYEQRVEVLKELGFVDEHARIELKGKVACEVSALSC